MEYLLFILGLILIIKSSDWFVDSSINIAKIYKVSDLIIGATIVSIGTTLPETLVSATASVKGFSDVAYGNALGSIFCNTALILSIALIAKEINVDRENIKYLSIFFYISLIYYMFISYTKGHFNRIDGIILLCIFIIYIIFMIKNKKDDMFDEKHEIKGSIVSNILILIISGLILSIGSRLLVDNGILIAKNLNVPNQVIAITFVALGTSLPELMTCINSIKKGHSGLSIGNIIGADLFNLVLVSSVSTIIMPFSLPNDKTIFGINKILIIDIPIIFLVVSIVIFPTLLKQKTYKLQGIFLLIIYILFVLYQFVI